jgi:type II secretory pathway component PulF
LQYPVQPVHLKTSGRTLPIIEGVVFLAGEWVPAWLGLTLTFLVAALGVVGLGWWVLRKDKMNRAAEEAALDSQTKEVHH